MFPDGNVDWSRVYAQGHPTPGGVDPRRRLRACLVGFALFSGVVFARVVQLEATQGAAFRREAARPLTRSRSLPGARGRILARDGSVLARDKKIPALAVHYRYLQQPPDPAWLRSMARSRLSRAERKDPGRVAAAEDEVRRETQELASQLAELCGLTPGQWARRAAEVQARVQQVAHGVNRRRQEAFEARRAEATRPGPSWLDPWLGPVEDAPPERITVREELDEHVMVESVFLAVIAEIEGRPERYPGVTIVERSRRDYPDGPLAAHVLGHLGAVTREELDADDRHAYQSGDRLGRMGLERQYERLLRGRRGEVVETTDRSGRVLSSYRGREPAVGRDLVLTLDARLQSAAESLLDEALRRRTLARAVPKAAGGAIVVMDVHTGAILAAASAPRFDPNSFAAGAGPEIELLLADPGKPLFDRVSRMAIPPGSVFKTLTAVALLEDGKLDPDKPLFCRGYLETPEAMRCQIYRRRGVGHGEVTLEDALAESCNVYFFHHAAALGANPLVNWARRFGFGEPTGIDLPGEAAGNVPRPEATPDGQERRWRAADTEMLAVGQGELTATPLQFARLMAAVANGGKLVVPHLVAHLGLGAIAENKPIADADTPPGDEITVPPPRPIHGLDAATLDAVRRGLRATVASPKGTAHATVFLDGVEIAGKTGTAETGGGLSDHAWFAGYVPAEKPRLAMVVVLEHSGDGGEVAGPVARRLVLRMRELGLF